MRPVLGYCTIGQHGDMSSVLNRREPMGNDHASAPKHGAFEAIPHKELRVGIHGARRLVQDEHGAVLEQCTAKAYEL